MKTKICQLCLVYSNDYKYYAWYTKTTNDYKTGRCITNLKICNACIKKIDNDIEILSLDELDEIPFKLKMGKQFEYHEINKFIGKF